MAFLDFVLDHTGAIGSRIRSISLQKKRDIQIKKQAVKEHPVDKRALEAQRDREIQRKPRSPKLTSIVSNGGIKLTFDAATDIQHEFTSEVTSYPVEDKSTVSDHVVNKNPTFRVSGIFSDSSDPTVKNPNKKSQSDVFTSLMQLRDSRTTLTLVTPLSAFDSLILTSISIPRSSGGGTALIVDMSFEKIRRVSNELTTVFVSGGTGADGATTKPSNDKDKKVDKSIEPNATKPKEGGVKTPALITKPVREKSAAVAGFDAGIDLISGLGR